MAMLHTIIVSTTCSGSLIICSSITPQIAEKANPAMLESVEASRTAPSAGADVGRLSRGSSAA
jgi:hypothetical protein